MPLIIALLCRIAVGAVRAIRNSRENKPAPLCADCSYAHVQYAANARRAISCTYNGGIRPMKLDVLYCTDYRDRDVPLRAGVIGFVYEIEPAGKSVEQCAGRALQ
jgi:hypothetical protein